MKIFKSLGGRLVLGTSALLLLAAFTDGPQPALAAEDESAPSATVVKPASGNLPVDFQPSPALQPVVTLAQSGVSEVILMAYINNQGIRVALTPEEIVFLRDLGISDEVITTLMLKPEGQPTVLPSATAANPVPPQPAPAAPVAGVAAEANAMPPAPAGVEAVNVAQPADAVTTNQFVEALAPYGNWVNVSGYGMGWQPSVVVINSSWRPYSDCGRWVWSNYGWYWQSDYSWGWAPFHYGRWYCHPKLSWVWFPDTCWGPSWVSWRYSPSYCGWAPLPPTACYTPSFGFTYYSRSVGISFEFGLGSSSYCFVPTKYFCAPKPRHHVVPADRNTAIYHSTTVVNNYASEHNHTVINRGIGRDAIARVTPGRLPEVEVREANGRNVGGSSGMVLGRILRSENGRSVVYRPSSQTENSIRNPASLVNETTRVAPTTTPPVASSRNLFRDGAGTRTPSNAGRGPESAPLQAAPSSPSPAAPSSLPISADQNRVAGVSSRNLGSRSGPDRSPGVPSQTPTVATSRTPAATQLPTVRPATPANTVVGSSGSTPQRLPVSSQPHVHTIQQTPRTPAPTPRVTVPQNVTPQINTAPVVTAPTPLPALPQRYGAPPSSRSSGQQLAQRPTVPTASSRSQTTAELISRMQSFNNATAPTGVRPSSVPPTGVPPSTISVPTGVKPSSINSVPTGVRPSTVPPTGVPPAVNSVPVGVRPSPIQSVPTGVRPSYTPPTGVPPSYGANSAPAGRSAGPTVNRGQPGNRGR